MFNPSTLKTKSSDGRNFILLEAASYTTLAGVKYIMPAGSTSDGASTPRELWISIPPFGDYWMSAFLHDCAYRNTLQLEDGSWAELTKDVCDMLFQEAMAVDGVEFFMRDAIYYGVAGFGKSSFDADRAKGRDYYMVNVLP